MSSVVVTGSGPSMTITVYVEPTHPRVCEVEGCEKPYKAQGLCRNHYMKERYQVCKEEIAAQQKDYYEAHKKEIAKAKRAYYEAHKEEHAASNAAWRARNPEKVKAIAAAWVARNPEKAKAYRNPEKAKAISAAWNAAHPDARSESRARRRARKLGNVTEAYDRLEIFERDEWVCQLCNLPIDPELRYPDPGFGTIDHVVPLVVGGSDEPTNVVAAHLVCNVRKGARLEPLPDNVTAFVTEFDAELPIITIEF